MASRSDHEYGTKKMSQFESKERILGAAAEMFSRYGIKSVTMDDIAKRLSISKKTIYQFFSDKDEIVHTLFEQQFAVDCAEFEQIAASAANVVEEVFGHMKKLHRKFSGANPNLFYDLRKYHPRAWELVTKFRQEAGVAMVEKALEKGKKDGFVRPDCNSKILARLRMEEIEMGFNADIFPPDQHAILDVQIAMVEHFLYGVCTLKGHKLINKLKEINEDE